MELDPSLQFIKNPKCAPIVQDAVRFFANMESIRFEIFLGKSTRWRTLAKIAVRSYLDPDSYQHLETAFGLFKPGTHKIIRGGGKSAVHHDLINLVLEVVQKSTKEIGVNGYTESAYGKEELCLKYKLFLRYVILAVERQSQTIQITLVWNGKNDATGLNKLSLDNLIESIKNSEIIKNYENQHKKQLIHSIWVNYNTNSPHNNLITYYADHSWSLRYGSPYIMEVLNISMKQPPKLFFPPNVFRQANIDAFTKIISNIRNWIVPTESTSTIKITDSKDDQNKKRKYETSSDSSKKGGCIENRSMIDSSQPLDLPRCVELYGGVGTIGLNCIDLLSKLSCFDENPHNKICFERSVSMLKKDYQKKICPYQSESASNVALSGGLYHCDLIIVDPPRKGLDEAVLNVLCGNEPVNTQHGKKCQDFDHSCEFETCFTCKRLIYVSCGFKAFKRDAMQLMGDGVANNKLSVHWKLIHAEGHLLFPGSDHIEVLAIFDLIR